MSVDKNVLLEVKNLKKYFPVKGGIFSRTVNFVKAVDGISFKVYKGETLGLVGESGCGKTTTARSILRLEDITDGEVLYKGRDIAKLSRKGMRPLRKEIQIIYQDPYSSLNPRMTVGQIVGEPLLVNGIAKGQELEKRVQELLTAVGLSRFQSRRYPHEFSGGQRQRIGIARALAVNPEIIFCDEPVSALDMSIQSQILNLFSELKKKFDLTYVFIAHDMSTVKHASDRVGVMYLGKLVELTDKRSIFADPQHPYTQALMSAIPIPDPDVVREEIVLEGDVPSPINPPSGCRFHTRCPVAIDKCDKEEPEFKDIGGGHFVACHLR